MTLRVMVFKAFSYEQMWCLWSPQRKLADQEFGWYCQERWFCAGFGVPHYYAGGGTKVSDIFQNIKSLFVDTHKPILLNFSHADSLFSNPSEQIMLTGSAHTRLFQKWWCHGLQSKKLETVLSIIYFYFPGSVLHV